MGGLLSLIGNACLGTYGDNFYFKGPNVGLFVSYYQLVTDRPIIVQCLIQDGEIVPMVMGVTRKNIVDWYESESKRQLLLFTCAAVLLYYVASAAKNAVGRLWKKLFKPIIHRKKFEPQNVEESLKCSVCMNKCRDVIFKNCKHLFICSQCLDLNPKQFKRCPICRQPVNDDILIIQQIDIQQNE